MPSKGYRNRLKTEAYFVSIGLMPPKEERTERWVLHHIDEEMIKRDKKRHDMFFIEDVIPLTWSEHSKYHHTGKTVSEETKKKISETEKGKEVPKEVGEKISKALIGVPKAPFTDEHKQKLADANKGKKLPKERCIKAGLGHKGKHNPFHKTIRCITTNRVFDSIQDFIDYFNLSDTSRVTLWRRLHAVLIGKAESYQGLQIEYYPEGVIDDKL